MQAPNPNTQISFHFGSRPPEVTVQDETKLLQVRWELECVGVDFSRRDAPFLIFDSSLCGKGICMIL